MKLKLLICTIALFLQTFLTLEDAKAQMDPRMKAIGLMAVYGTVGGTLLGTASLAFGAEGRSVAKGASLGLYAGLLFGGYVVASHAMKKHKDANPEPQENYYPDSSSPYEEGEEGEEDEGTFFRWNPYEEMNAAYLRPVDNYRTLKGPEQPPLFYFNIVNLSF